MEAIKQFDRVVLTMENVIIPKERLLNTPSLKDGMTRELEVDLRITGCHYIQSAGILLKLPQVIISHRLLINCGSFYHRLLWRQHKFFFTGFIMPNHL